MILDILKATIKPLLGPLLDKIPDVNERRRLEASTEQGILAAVSSVVLAQISVNEQEAKHASIFVAGWRPYIGWVCGFALAWNFILLPLIMWVAFLFDADLKGAPKLDSTELYVILGGMLGTATLRSIDKRNGVARSSL